MPSVHQQRLAVRKPCLLISADESGIGVEVLLLSSCQLPEDRNYSPGAASARIGQPLTVGRINSLARLTGAFSRDGDWRTHRFAGCRIDLHTEDLSHLRPECVVQTAV